MSIKIVSPHAEFVTPKFWDKWAENVPKLLEECGRVSHKSEDRITLESAAPFLSSIAISLGHESILEHAGFTVCYVGSRAMSHQLVRHRIGSYTQESQRYCDYSVDDNVTSKVLSVIMPPSVMGCSILDGITVPDCSLSYFNKLICGLMDKTSTEVSSREIRQGYEWCMWQISAYNAYNQARESGIPSEDARFHLTNACKTEVYVTYNFRTWRHVLGHPTCGRALNNHAQWEIKKISLEVLEMFKTHLPYLFNDLGKKITFDQAEIAIICEMITGNSIVDLYKKYGMTKTKKKIFDEKLDLMQKLSMEAIVHK